MSSTQQPDRAKPGSGHWRAAPGQVRQPRVFRLQFGSFLLAVAALVSAPVLAVPPELPRAYLDTTYAPPTGNTITVNAGGNLQAAINAAQPGDTIVLQAGATFTGTFTLPNKGTSTQWIYIRSSAIGALPGPGNRVTPMNVTNMPTIAGTGSPVIAIQTLAGAHHYRFVGIEFKPVAGQFSTGLIRLGNGETSLGQLPHNIVFDRCYIHGDPNIGGRRGIAMNGASSAVIDSYLSDWKEVGADTQAIGLWNTPGPLKIVNNHLEGAGENILVGGADSTIFNLVPSDIELRGNYFFKPIAWRTQNWVVKNLFELKNSRRTLMEGNVFEYDWAAAQDFALNIKSSNQDGGAPWSGTEDFTFRHNVIRHLPSAIKVCALSCDGAVTPQGRRFLIQNNLFDDINSVNWDGSGNFLQTSGPVPDLVVNHNTVVHNGSMFSGGEGGNNTNFQFTDNIVQRGPSGFKGSGAGEGNGTLNLFFPGAVFVKNVLIGANSTSYPPNNFFPATYTGVRFVDIPGGDFRLATTSTYKNAGADGKDVGADLVAVNAATACAISGQCMTPYPPPTTVDPFSFTNQTNIQPGALVTSNIVTVTGSNFNLPVTISISGGGAYSIGCTDKSTSTTGLISAGQTFCIRYRTPPGVNVTTVSTVTINGVSASMSVTNAATLSAMGDADNDGIPNSIEPPEGRNQIVKDNDIFTNARLFSMQQFRDFLGREGDSGGINFYTSAIGSGQLSRPAAIEAFYKSPENQSTAAPVVRLYFATFLRFPDYGGLDFHIKEIRAGSPLAVVANNFTLSPEFQARYGGLTNSQYVTLLYQNILSRSPSQSELNFHVNRLNSGVSRGEVLTGFSESPEYIASYKSEVDVILIYSGLFRRVPDPAEFSQWLSFLDGGNAFVGMATNLYNSDEYRTRGFIP